MQYIETQLTFSPAIPENRETLAALLAEIGYDSFMDTPTGLSAYIPADAFSSEATEAAIEPVRPLFEQLTVESKLQVRLLIPQS